jgi:alpha-galactosidase
MIDNCANQFKIGKDSSIARYTAMRDALNATGRPIHYNMCNWGQAQSWEWYVVEIAYMSRERLASD